MSDPFEAILKRVLDQQEAALERLRQHEARVLQEFDHRYRPTDPEITEILMACQNPDVKKHVLALVRGQGMAAPVPG